MQGFKQVLNEDRNTHLEHLEDEIINNGTSGAKTSIEFLKSIKKMLQGGKGRFNCFSKMGWCTCYILWYQSREW